MPTSGTPLPLAPLPGRPAGAAPRLQRKQGGRRSSVRAFVANAPEERSLPVLEELLRGVVEEPLAEDRWHVLADWLEEYDDPDRAELLRLHRRLLATCCEPESHPQRAGWQARVVELLAKGVSPCVPRRAVLLGKRVKVPLTFAWVGPGTFLMGSPEGEEGRGSDETLHRVTLARGFWMGVYPVTQAQWRWATGKRPSKFRGARRPVERVSWHDCQAFCSALGKKTGQRFRLPSEAEWEYACRAGTTTPFYCGETLSTDRANYDGNLTYGAGRKGPYRHQTTSVGSFPPNPWGLYDMHSNVWQWCQDRFAPYPDGGADRHPGKDSARVLRGDCWALGPSGCRSAFRDWHVAGLRGDGIGCRVCLCHELPFGA
jgi:uncharacterized protein (TIGR02996 family)